MFRIRQPDPGQMEHPDLNGPSILLIYHRFQIFQERKVFYCRCYRAAQQNFHLQEKSHRIHFKSFLLILLDETTLAM